MRRHNGKSILTLTLKHPPNPEVVERFVVRSLLLPFIVHRLLSVSLEMSWY